MSKIVKKHQILLKNNNLFAQKFYKCVLSGDTSNVEAQAARIYFSSLFGDNFLRNTEKTGINSFLNYGYTIIRTAISRFVIGVGLKHHLG